MSVLNPLYEAVAYLLVHIHEAVAPVFGADSGLTWVLSVVLLTMAMRLILIPVFVKQIRSQRAMQIVQPRMKELQTKYKHDKEKLNQEMMKLWKETGTNPLAGCLPLLLQIPIFIALFHILNTIKPSKSCANAHLLSCYKHVPGLPQHLIASAANAKIFGVPFAAAFNSNSTVLHILGGHQTSTRILCAVLTVIMVVTTFITQRQLMARNGPAATSQMAQQQKILLYVFPLFFLLYGYRFPIGVLFYWLTTNLWSMAQQFVVIRRMDTVATEGPTPPPSGPAVGAKPPRKPLPPAPAPPKPAAASPGGGSGAPGAARTRPSNNRRPSGRSKNRKGRR